METSFKTTNLIESVMAQAEAKTGRADRWRTRDQKLRWCTSPLLVVETQFRRERDMKTPLASRGTNEEDQYVRERHRKTSYCVNAQRLRRGRHLNIN